ncbi:MAG TPA: NAD-dependent epimerase/dehydratase family protein [Acidimicrobiales bacterium]|nr:NAD-dependent epimerase/dehydratase family protein [Acidimicrobiales bacterium]
MNILVTGGAGFIGANLCRALAGAEDVDRIIALDDLSSGNRQNLSGVSGVELVEGTVLDRDAVGDLVAGVDAIVHLAARPSVPRSLEDPWASHEANATGTLSVLEAARASPPETRPHVVVASSSSVYGANPTLPKSEGMVALPLSPYAASKLATEAYTLAYGHSFGLDVLVFRFFNVFGPLQTAGHAYAAVVPAFISAALKGEPLTINGDGTQTRDFTYVGSVVEVLTAVLRQRLTHDTPVNLAFGSRVSLLELVEALEAVLGRPLPRRHARSRQGDVAHSQADQRLLRNLLPDTVPVDLVEGLRLTVDWFEGAAR